MALADCYGVRAAPSKAVENLEPPRHVAGFFAEHKVRARSLERQPLWRGRPRPRTRAGRTLLLTFKWNMAMLRLDIYTRAFGGSPAGHA